MDAFKHAEVLYHNNEPVSDRNPNRDTQKTAQPERSMLPKVKIDNLPHYVVTKREGGRLFNAHCSSLDGLWRESSKLITSEHQEIESDGV
jgi:hypothetical protein